MSAASVAGVCAGRSALPQPWTTIAGCRLWAEAGLSSDTGNPTYSVTSITDRAGGAALNVPVSFVRTAPPALYPMGNLTTVHSISRSGNATMLTAANNGDYSFAFRGQRAAANQPMWGIHNSVNSRLTNIFFDASTIRLQRDNGGGSTYWLVGGQSFTVGTLYTVGVSVDRVNGTTTTSYFYLNGALVGSQSQTTLDIDFTGSSELIGSIIAGISPRGAYVGGGNWSTLLTGPDHLVIHNYLSATYP